MARGPVHAPLAALALLGSLLLLAGPLAVAQEAAPAPAADEADAPAALAVADDAATGRRLQSAGTGGIDDPGRDPNFQLPSPVHTTNAQTRFSSGDGLWLEQDGGHCWDTTTIKCMCYTAGYFPTPQDPVNSRMWKAFLHHAQRGGLASKEMAGISRLVGRGRKDTGVTDLCASWAGFSQLDDPNYNAGWPSSSPIVMNTYSQSGSHQFGATFNQGSLRASDSPDVAAAERLEFDNRLKTALCRQSFTKNREAGFGNATENHFLCEDGGNIWI